MGSEAEIQAETLPSISIRPSPCHYGTSIFSIRTQAHSRREILAAKGKLKRNASCTIGRPEAHFARRTFTIRNSSEVRGAVEIHMSNQSDINRVETARCYRIPRDEWPEAKAATQKYIVNHPEGATLRVHTDGSAEIVSRNNRSPVSRGRNVGLDDYVRGVDGASKHTRERGDEARQHLLNRSVHPQLQGLASTL